jgi:hypothetical protein
MVIMMLTHQPLIVGGIEDLGMAKANAYGALFTFVFSFGVSIFYLIQDTFLGGRYSFNRQLPRRRYSDGDHVQQLQDYEYAGVPTNSSALQERNASNLDLPRSVQEGVFS